MKYYQIRFIDYAGYEIAEATIPAESLVDALTQADSVFSEYFKEFNKSEIKRVTVERTK